ncbi:unnamed protein product, partial [Brassica oleracea]
MGQLVKLVVGVWEEVGHRGWLFLEDPTERKHEVMVHENQTYASVLDLVRTRYSVGLETAVTLTYEFPEWMKGPGDLSPPPVDVREDGDVELFMSIRIELPATRLMVTIGNDVVARYLFQRRDNYTVIGSSKGVTSDNTRTYPPRTDVSLYENTVNVNASRVPGADGSGFWEGMVAQCIVTASQQFLTNVFANEDVTLGGNAALAERMPPTDGYIDSSDGTNSSTASSPHPCEKGDELFESGIIRLAEELPVAPAVANKVLAIVEAEPGRKSYSILEYITKGKEKVCNESEEKKKRSYNSGPRGPLMSNPNFPDPIPDADTTDEDSEEEAEKHLFVGQVFMDRTAFKTHMSLYALANKFRFLCRRSEPGKMVLICRGSECKWRVYASKLPGCPQFQIKKLDEGHTCTVDERGDFKRHATSNLIGEMVRNKFGSGGTGPRPGALREFMRTDHHVPISYWKAWKSRELAKERGLGNTADSYRMLPAYLSQLAGVPFVVDLEAKTCSCLEFDMIRIPCGHAVAAAIHSNRRVDELVGE